MMTGEPFKDRSKSKFPIGITCICLAVTLTIIAGCSSSSKKETSLPSPQLQQSVQPTQVTSKPTTEPEKPSFNLKVPSHMPASYSNQEAAQNWAKTVEEKTNGRIKFTFYPLESLVAGKDLFDSVSTGRTEMAILPEAYVSSILPIAAVWDIPFLFNGSQGMKKTLDNGMHELLRGIYLERNVVTINRNIYSWVSLGAAKKELRKPEDLKGLRVRAASIITQRTVEALGGAGIWMSSTEVYMALQRNTIDAAWHGIDDVMKRKLYEVAKYLGSEKIFTSAAVLAVNKAVWDKIAPEDKEIMEDLAKKIYSEGQLADVDRIDQEAIKAAKEKGVQLTEWTPGEREAWKKAMQPVAIDYFLSQTGERGKKAVDIAQKYGT